MVELAATETDPVLARSLYLKAAEHYATQLGDMDGAVALLQPDPRVRSGATKRCWPRSRRCTACASAGTSCSACCAARPSSPSDPGRKEAAPGADGRGPSRASSASRRRPSRAIARSSRSIRRSARALVGARRPVRGARPCGPSSRTTCSRQLDLAEDPAEQTAYMLRLATPARAPHGRGRGRHRDLPRGAVARSVQRRGARARSSG